MKKYLVEIKLQLEMWADSANNISDFMIESNEILKTIDLHKKAEVLVVTGKDPVYRINEIYEPMTLESLLGALEGK